MILRRQRPEQARRGRRSCDRGRDHRTVDRPRRRPRRATEAVSYMVGSEDEGADAALERSAQPGTCPNLSLLADAPGNGTGPAGPHGQGKAHPRHAGQLRHRCEGGPHPGGPGRHPVRARRGAGDQAVARSRGWPTTWPSPSTRARIRIEAPIPGEPYVGVEIPNAAFDLVTLKEVLGSKTFASHGRRWRARLRAGPGRRRPAVRRGPVTHAAHAHRGRHRIGQERVRERDDLLAADAEPRRTR